MKVMSNESASIESPTREKARFVTVEGSEGAGKSTNIAILSEVLSERGIDFYCTREPGGTKLAEEIRELILSPRDETVDGVAELLLMFAARRQHVTQEIQPRLEAGQWVICDRFTDATIAYQGFGRGLDLEWISTLQAWVQQGLEPNLTLYFDVPPAVGAARIANREQDRLEQEQAAFFERVRAGYLHLAETETRFTVVDASRALEDVGEEVRRLFTAFVDEVGLATDGLGRHE